MYDFIEGNLKNYAFFFQGDFLLLPADVGDLQVGDGVPLEMAKDFNASDIFDVPSVDDSALPVRVVSVLPKTALPEGWKSISLRQVLTILSTRAPGSGTGGDGESGRIIRACHIAQWRQDSLFCGRCGAKNTDGVSSKEVHRLCPVCGRIEFPRICPAVITVITDDENRILLAHNRKFKEGMYSLVSGFNEAGETLEATVAREIREEVNIEVRDIAYVKSQPWPFPNSLMLGFKAGYASGTVRPDGVEIEDAKWFTKDNLPQLPGYGSLSRYLIDRWSST
jgi:NAD+ diphosphatase